MAQRCLVDRGRSWCPAATCLHQVAEEPGRDQPGERGEHVQAEQRTTSVRGWRAVEPTGRSGGPGRPSATGRISCSCRVSRPRLLRVTVARVARAPGRAGRGGAPVGDDPAVLQERPRSSARSSSSGLVVTTTVVRPGACGAEPGRDPGLGVGVDRRGRLDQDQDLRVGEQGPGQPQPLPLAAGELPARARRPAVSRPSRQRVEDVGGAGRCQRRGAAPPRTAGRVAGATSSSSRSAPAEQARRRCRRPGSRSAHLGHGQVGAGARRPSVTVAVGSSGRAGRRCAAASSGAVAASAVRRARAGTTRPERGSTRSPAAGRVGGAAGSVMLGRQSRGSGTTRRAATWARVTCRPSR